MVATASDTLESLCIDASQGHLRHKFAGIRLAGRHRMFKARRKIGEFVLKRLLPTAVLILAQVLLFQHVIPVIYS
jgi:hypothetical protein